MSTPELYISMSELLDVPVVTIAGIMHGAHVPALTAILAGMADFGKSSFVFDVANLDCPGDAEAENVVDLMRSVPSSFRVHLVCSGLPRKLMSKAHLGKKILIYATTDEIAKLLHKVWASQQPLATPAHHTI